MNYCLNPNLQMRNEAFGKILYNRFGMLSFVDHETSGFLDLLKIGPQSLEMLTQKSPEKSKNKLYEFIIV